MHTDGWHILIYNEVQLLDTEVLLDIMMILFCKKDPKTKTRAHI